MSRAKNRYEAHRWLQTAQEDLHAAKVLHDSGVYAQACYLSQQCAEKCLKAMWYPLDRDPWGHSIKRLVREFPELQRISDCFFCEGVRNIFNFTDRLKVSHFKNMRFIT
jgi:HEPN domain-containing protein